MEYAPIALFVYNRPEHTRKTVEALLQNAEAARSDLFIFSDGAKTKEDTAAVVNLREYLKSISGFKSIEIVMQQHNLGLANSIISGVSSLIERFGRVIVLEDDIVTGKFFLRFMNESLDKYANNDQVASIVGYNFPVHADSLPDSFFLVGADCWGWATWKRCWTHFEPDTAKLLNEVQSRGLEYALDMNGSYPYTQMLRDQIAGKVNSWAVRWYVKMFLMGKMSLYPGSSLVQNIGFDGSGIHCNTSDVFDTRDIDHPIRIFPGKIAEDERMKKLKMKFYRKHFMPAGNSIKSFLKKIRNRLLSMTRFG